MSLQHTSAIWFFISFLSIILDGLPSHGQSIIHEWDASAGDSLWGTVNNWDTSSVPGSTDPIDEAIRLTGTAASGPQTIDLGGTTREISRIEAAGFGGSGGYSFTNGTIGIFQNGANTIVGGQGAGPLTFDTDVKFSSLTTAPRFNVGPSGVPIIFNGDISGSSIFGTTLELTSRNTSLPSSITINGNISDGSSGPLGIRAGFEAAASSHRGVVTLKGANTYTRPTVVNGATLEFNSIGNVNSSGTEPANALGLPTSVAKGTISLGAENANPVGTVPGTLRYIGTGHTSDRVIELAADGAGGVIDATGTGPLILNAPAVSVLPGTKTLTLRGKNTGANELQSGIPNPSSGNLNLVKGGPGSWVLSGENSYQGGTVINGGRLVLEIDPLLDNHFEDILPIAGGIVNNSELAFTSTDLNLSSYSGLISGTGDVYVSGANSVVLSLGGLNTYTGETIIERGFIRFNRIADAGEASEIGAGSVIRMGSNIVPTVTLEYSGPEAQTNRQIILEGSNSKVIRSFNELTLNGIISGAASSLRFSRRVKISAVNTYVGTTEIDRQSTLSIASITNQGVPGPLGQTSSLTILDDNGTLEFTGTQGTTDRRLSLTSNEFSSDGSTINIDVTLGELAFTGLVTGGNHASQPKRDFFKRGSGTLIFSRNNSYAHDTIVEAGSFFVNNTTGSGTGSGDVTVQASATLGGSGAISGNVLIEGFGALAPGDTIGTLTVGGDVTLSDDSDMVFDLAGPMGGEFDFLSIGGAADIDGRLIVDLEDDFVPSVNDVFTILTAGTLTGDFDNLTQSNRVSTDDGLGSFLVDIDAIADEVVLSDFRLKNPGPGDFDGDADVDGADFLLWQRNFPAFFTAADLDDWEANYGTQPAAIANQIAVPEPTSLGLMAMSTLICLARPRKRLGLASHFA